MLRLTVLLFLAVAAFFTRRDSFGDVALYVVDIPLAALIVANILSTIWLYQHLLIDGTLEEEQLYLQVFLDVMVMGMVVFYTGASTSTLALIFLVPVVLASAFLYLRGSLFAASLSAVVLAALFTLDANGWLAEYGSNYRQAAVDFTQLGVARDLLSEWVLAALALFAAAATSGYLAKNQLSVLREVGELTRRLERIRINTSDVLTNLESGLLTVDTDGTIIFLNRAAREILQVESPEPEGRNYEIVLAGHLEPLGQMIHNALLGVPLSRRNEIDIEFGSNRPLPLGVSPTVLRDNGIIRGVILIFQDLTEAKLLEERLRRQDRLAVIGELGAGIAHELRNPLASISGSADVLQTGLDVDGEDRQLLDLIVNESARINDIVEQFLSYARIKRVDMHPVDLRRIVEEVFSLARNHPNFSQGQEIVVELEQCPLVLADDAQMKQVFLNLVLNGLEALGGPGRICVCSPSADEGFSRWPDLAEIWVQDEGPGVPKDEVERIFEPFYTNKQGGTGLGLAVVQRIVESHEGHILYAPTSDGTSTFRVFLPKGEQAL